MMPFPSFGSNKTYTKKDMSLALEALRYLGNTFPAVKIKKFSLLTFGEKFKLRNLDPDPEFLPNLDPDPDPEGYLLPVPIN